MADPGNVNNGGSTGNTDIPPDVLNYLYGVAGGDVGKFQQLVNQWLAQHNALSAIAAAIPPDLQQNGVQTDQFHIVDPATGAVYLLGKDAKGSPVYTKMSITDSKAYLKSLGVDVSQLGGSGGGSGGSGGGGGGGVDPQELKLQYDQLLQQYTNMGLDAESARRQALASLIQSRNSDQVNLASAEASNAAQAAQFAANPRDAVAELQYRNATGGVPFGDFDNQKFPQYQTALSDKFQNMFGGTADAFKRAQEFLNAPPPSEFLQPSYTGPGSENINQHTTLPAAAPAAAAAPSASNPLADLVNRLNSFSPQQKADFQNYVTGGAAQATPQQFSAGGTITDTERRMRTERTSGGIAGFAAGGTVSDAPRLSFGYRPPSSEGGTNMNIHEPSVVMGMHSGHVYATLSEHAPEQMIIKPLPSVQKAQKQYDAMTKQQAQATAGARRNDDGGEIGFGTDPSQFINELRKNLSRLGGPGGGVGAFTTQLPSLRLLAGAPANALANDPVLNDYTMAGYSSLGIDPRTVQAAIQQYTPSGVVNNSPRLSFV